MLSGKWLQWLAAALVAGALIFWIATGAHQGWTRTSVMVRTLDPVTEIEAITYEKKFVPGVDFLAVALAAGFLLGAVSALRRRRSAQPTSPLT
jgi:tyrosine-protein phosphatase YwqE